MNIQQKKLIFLISFIFPLVFYRLIVYLRDGKVSLLRELTGFQVHHYHYGILFVIIAVILILFHKVSIPAIILSGFGVGAMLDGFIASLLPSINRAEEIVNYQITFIPSLILFLGVVLIVLFVRKE